MKQILLLVLAVVLVSCNSFRDYEYIAHFYKIENGDTVRYDQKQKLQAADDVSAYTSGYNRYALYVKNKYKYFQDMPGFSVINDSGVDISNTIAPDIKDSVHATIDKLVFGDKLTLSKVLSYQPQNIDTPTKDSTKIKSLMKYFRVKRDEFSNDNESWVIPKSAPQYTNSNGIYVYFATKNGKAHNIRFRLNYYAEDWLFIQGVKFSVDGEAYAYVPGDVERDNDGGMIWEWFDDKIVHQDVSLIEALASAKSAKMKIVGSQYHKVKSISTQQLRDIGRSIELFKELGGRW